MKRHQHHMIPSKRETFGWTYCVATVYDGGKACPGKAHGGVMHVDYCSCGAVRRMEANGVAQVRSEWIRNEDDEKL